MPNRSLAVPVVAFAVFACAQRPGEESERDDSQSVALHSPDVGPAEHHDSSPPLFLMEPAARREPIDHEAMRVPIGPAGRFSALPLETLQSSIPPLAVPTTSLSFDGVGESFTGPAGAFSVASAPPDTNGDVGPNHYVQIVNTDFTVFNKTGSALFGPVPINTLWSGFGGGCQTNNDGDPTVVYDSLADRWVISQFSVSTTPFLQCVAVSQTGDPTGAYFRYSFSYGNTDFNDYPKIGVWPDAYYMTFNIFANAKTFSGAKACAYDRAKMLTGAAAGQQCFQTSNQWGGLLPADLDGSNPPPAGSPNYLVAFGTNDLGVWRFHVDWSTPASSTFSGPSLLPVGAFTPACNGGGTCIPQSGTAQQLDSLADRLMYRLAYRNFADHEALVVSHSVTAGSGAGVRWYELRPDASHNLSVFQQGTYAPDANFRWMGSMAMDKQGNIALGFSVSSSSLHPQIHYTGRLAGDPAGQMTQGEGTIVDGNGSQSGSSLSRWGDYSMMAIDPADDCTFWYTTEYLNATGAFNWRTRVGAFKFPGCGAAAANDFAISASPGVLSLNQGASGTSIISTAVVSGTAGTVSLSASAPAGLVASLSAASVTAGGSATLTLTAGATTAAGAYTVTVIGVEGTATHAASITVNVNGSTAPGGIVNGGFETGDLSGWTSTGPGAAVAGGHSGNFAARVGSTAPFSGDASIAQTFSAPAAGGTLSFWYKIVCTDTVTFDWATATLRDNTAATTATVLPKTCANTGAWAQATAVLAGGHNYTLTLIDHDDGFASDPTYTLYDDVSIGAAQAGGGIVNGGFESGTLSGWTKSGTASITTTSHSGSFAALAGSTVATNGDSSLMQTFTAPAAATQLSLFYANNCPDTVTFDWATIALRDETAGVTRTLLPRTCAPVYQWTNLTASIVGGHSYTLTLTNHDDGFAGDPTYTLFDDVVLR